VRGAVSPTATVVSIQTTTANDEFFGICSDIYCKTEDTSDSHSEASLRIDMSPERDVIDENEAGVHNGESIPLVTSSELGQGQVLIPSLKDSGASSSSSSSQCGTSSSDVTLDLRVRKRRANDGLFEAEERFPVTAVDCKTHPEEVASSTSAVEALVMKKIEAAISSADTVEEKQRRLSEMMRELDAMKALLLQQQMSPSLIYQQDSPAVISSSVVETKFLRTYPNDDPTLDATVSDLPLNLSKPPTPLPLIKIEPTMGTPPRAHSTPVVTSRPPQHSSSVNSDPPQPPPAHYHSLRATADVEEMRSRNSVVLVDARMSADALIRLCHNGIPPPPNGVAGGGGSGVGGGGRNSAVTAGYSSTCSIVSSSGHISSNINSSGGGCSAGSNGGGGGRVNDHTNPTDNRLVASADGGWGGGSGAASANVTVVITTAAQSTSTTTPGGGGGADGRVKEEEGEEEDVTSNNVDDALLPLRKLHLFY